MRLRLVPYDPDAGLRARAELAIENIARECRAADDFTPPADNLAMHVHRRKNPTPAEIRERAREWNRNYEKARQQRAYTRYGI